MTSRRAGFSARVVKALTHPSISSLATNRPLMPSITASDMPETFDAMIGRPAAIASSNALGMPSSRAGSTNTSALR